MKNRKRHGGKRANRGSFSKNEMREFGYQSSDSYRPRYAQSYPEWVKVGQKLSEINRAKSKFNIRDHTWKIFDIRKLYDGWIFVSLKCLEFPMTTEVKVHRIHLRFAPIYE